MQHNSDLQPIDLPSAELLPSFIVRSFYLLKLSQEINTNFYSLVVVFCQQAFCFLLRNLDSSYPNLTLNNIITVITTKEIKPINNGFQKSEMSSCFLFRAINFLNKKYMRKGKHATKHQA